MKNKYFDKSFFKSRIFRGLFSSYVVIICLIFMVYLVIMGYETKAVNYEKKDQYYNSGIDKLSNSIDSALMDAMIIASDINASDTINKYAMINKGILQDKITGSDVVSEIRNYTISRYNINIYDTMLFLDGTSEAFSSVQTYSLENVYENNRDIRMFVQNTSINELLGMNNNTVIFNKEFAVYMQRYNTVYARGIICVLFDAGCIDSIVKDLFKAETNIRISMGDNIIYEAGTVDNPVEYIEVSALNSDCEYKIEADKNNFGMIFNGRFMIIFIIAQVLSIIFIIVSAYLSLRFYKPVGKIEKMVGERSGNAGSNEFDNISDGIRKLIYENNDYKEKIISIEPYVQKGILHSMMSEGIEMVPHKEEYDIIHKKYYIIGAVNIACISDNQPEISYYSYLRNVIEEQAHNISNEMMNIWLYDKDRFNVYVIVNSDTETGMEDVFYELYKAIASKADTEAYAITIGADRVRTDISELSQACQNCVEALSNIITAGRNAVYFYTEQESSPADDYYFPPDTAGKLTACIKECNYNQIKVILDDIMHVNVKKYSDNVKVIDVLIDELHVTTVKVLKKVFNEHPVNFRFEKVRFTATIEEIFGYYEDIYNKACDEYRIIHQTVKQHTGNDRDIIRVIDENITNPELSLAYITERFNVSNKYISTLCKKQLGQTYIQYVQEIRIKLATEYIKQGGYTLDEIAQMCGYTSMLTFRRNFKNVTGVNPSEYNV